MYAVIEMTGHDIVGVRLYNEQASADIDFDACVEENTPIQEYGPADFEHECRGTIRMAGDDCYCVQMLVCRES